MSRSISSYTDDPVVDPRGSEILPDGFAHPTIISPRKTVTFDLTTNDLTTNDLTTNDLTTNDLTTTDLTRNDATISRATTCRKSCPKPCLKPCSKPCPNPCDDPCSKSICRNERPPWPAIIIAIIGIGLLVYTAVGFNIPQDRRIFGIVMILLWTLLWIVILWVLWRRCQTGTTWWLLIVGVSILVLFFVIVIALNLGN